jgi:hypothetical protein
METKAFPAFGYVVIRHQIEKNEILNDELYDNGLVTIAPPFDTCWLYTKGLVNQVNIDTQKVSVRGPGYCNALIKETAGVWRADFKEDSTVFCVPQPKPANPLILLIDNLQVFSLKAGQSTTLAQSTKLSLCQGQLKIGSATIRDLRQIEFKSGSRSVIAIEDCFGLIFP